MTGPQPETERGVYMEIRAWRAWEPKGILDTEEVKKWFQSCRNLVEAITRVFCIVYAENGYSIRVADYLRSYYIDCEIVDKDGYFKLKTYENVTEEYDVSVKTVANGLKNGLEALTEIWPDITRDSA